MFNILNEIFKIIKDNDFIKFNNETENIINFDVSFNIDLSDTVVLELCKLHSLCKEAIIISHAAAPRFSSNNTDDLNSVLTKNISKLMSYGKNQINYNIKINKVDLLKSINPQKNNIKFHIVWANDTFIKSIDSIFSSDQLNFPYVDINYYNIIILVDSDIYINNEFMTITCLKKFKINEFENISNNHSILSKKIEFKRDNCHLEFNAGHLPVDLFIFEYSYSDLNITDRLKSSIDSLIIKLSLIHLCNIGTLSDSLINLKFKGERVIDIPIPRYSIINFKNIKYLIELYNIAYSSVKIESLYMVRNTISLYVCDDCSINALTSFDINIKDIVDACKYNLQISSINNVNNYFATRYTLFEFLDNNVQKIKDQISSLISKMNSTFLSTIASIVGISLVYLKDKNITILKISLLIYSLYLFIDCISTFSFNWFSYRKILSEFTKKKNTFKPLLEPYEEIDKDYLELKNTKIMFITYYIIYLIIYILMISISTLSFFNLEFTINILKEIF